MLRLAYLLLSTLSAVVFAFECLRENRRSTCRLLAALIPAAAICLLVEYVFYDGLALISPLLLAASAIWQSAAENREGCGLYLFLLAGSAFSVLRCIWDGLAAAGGFWSDIKLPVCGVLLLALVLLPRVYDRWLPAVSWREMFQGRRFGGFSVRAVDTATVIWGMGCMLPCILGCSSLPACLALCAGFVGGLFLIALMIAYQAALLNSAEALQRLDSTQRFMSVVRSQRHDYNFHLHTLQTLLLREDYIACQEYLAELVEDSTSMNALLPLADPAICALVNAFCALAAQAGTSLHLEIRNDLSRIATNPYETNKILGNLLQNAIDETIRLGDRTYGIHLTTMKRGRYCMIRVSNQIRDPASAGEYQVGVSSKDGHEGIGLAAARELAAKHQGTVYSRIEGDVIHFVAKIPFHFEPEAVE